MYLAWIMMLVLFRPSNELKIQLSAKSISCVETLLVTLPHILPVKSRLQPQWNLPGFFPACSSPISAASFDSENLAQALHLLIVTLAITSALALA